jgi:hypothetical protein
MLEAGAPRRAEPARARRVARDCPPRRHSDPDRPRSASHSDGALVDAGERGER